MLGTRDPINPPSLNGSTPCSFISGRTHPGCWEVLERTCCFWLLQWPWLWDRAFVTLCHLDFYSWGANHLPWQYSLFPGEADWVVIVMSVQNKKEIMMGSASFATAILLLIKQHSKGHGGKLLALECYLLHDSRSEKSLRLGANQTMELGPFGWTQPCASCN